jgi:putative RecB family exonuclease
LTVYSHSRLSSFENCPLQYRYRYIDRIRTGFESIEAFMGKRVHEVLEQVYRDLPRARAGGLPVALAAYERLWRESLTPNVRVIRPDLDVEYYRALGARCVAGYWERHFPFPIETDQIIGIELKVELALDAPGRFRMMGYVDRAQHAGPGVIEIHDYKTTATLPKEGSLRFDRQLPLYEIALRQRFPETKEVRLIWHFLAHDAGAIETRTAKDLDGVKSKCISLIQTVERARDFAPKKGPLCSWCDYQDVCPEWVGVKPAAPPAFPNGRPAEDSGPLGRFHLAAAPRTDAAPRPGEAVSPPTPASAPSAPASPKRSRKRAPDTDAQLPLF